jgi:hypothetical protein
VLAELWFGVPFYDILRYEQLNLYYNPKSNTKKGSNVEQDKLKQRILKKVRTVVETRTNSEIR